MRTAVSLLFLVLAFQAQANADEDPQMILNHLNQASESFRQRLKQISGEARIIEKSGSGATAKEIQTVLDFQTDFPKLVVHRKLHMDSDPSLYLETVQGFDGESVFFVKKDQENAPFAVSSFNRLSTSVEYGRTEFYNYLDRYLFAPTLLSSLTIAEIARNPKFSVGRVAKLENGDYRLSYTLDDPSLVYGSGWIELGESTGWLIRKSDCRLGSLASKRRCLTSVVFGLNRQGDRIPEQVNVSHQPITGASFANGEFYLVKLDAAQPNARAFSPSNYGLGDLANQARRGPAVSISQICLIAAPVFLLIAILLRYRATRK